VEQFNRLLPAFIQNFVEKSSQYMGLQIEGDLNEAARFSITGEDGQWLRNFAESLSNGLPDYLSVHGNISLPNQEGAKVAFLRPGDMIFDALCQEVMNRFQKDIQRGAVFCDPKAKEPYYTGVYICQLGESSSISDKGHGSSLSNRMDRRLIGLKWDESGEFDICHPNHLLALHAAPPTALWKAGNLLRNPEEHVAKADAYALLTKFEHGLIITKFSPVRMHSIKQ
jgi:hypothetical protein